MHKACYDWVGGVVAEYDLAARSTIEIGSANINGTVRDFFTGAYVGVDIAEGNGVDRVGDSEQMEDASEAWSVCISCEMLEHAHRPWRAVAEMARITQHDGHVIVTARGYDDRGCWEVHGYPSDYWRLSEGAMRTIAEDAGLDVLEVTADPEGPGFFLHAVKP
jgi:SAM-dependent methyltransferase